MAIPPHRRCIITTIIIAAAIVACLTIVFGLGFCLGAFGTCATIIALNIYWEVSGIEPDIDEDDIVRSVGLHFDELAVIGEYSYNSFMTELKLIGMAVNEDHAAGKYRWTSLTGQKSWIEMSQLGREPRSIAIPQLDDNIIEFNPNVN